MMLFESTHPLVKHKLTLLRDITTEPKKFRELIRELAMLLAYEATANLKVRNRSVLTPMGEAEGYVLNEKIGLVPILRAGLGMVEGIWEMMPSAEVWHIGLYRDEETLKPVFYYSKLPTSPTVDVCLILDPMLATGGSAVAAADQLKRWGANQIMMIAILAAPEGIERLQQAHPDIPIFVAKIDQRLNDIGYIVPGLGDAGDRQFGTG
jgi:uracil phosphoribosyltransferase